MPADRDERAHGVTRTLDAIATDLDRLEAALAAGVADLPEPVAPDLTTGDVERQRWSEADRARAAALLHRNRALTDQLVARMREQNHARRLLGDIPNLPRYLDTIA